MGSDKTIDLLNQLAARNGGIALAEEAGTYMTSRSVYSMPHMHDVTDYDTHFIIDKHTRNITNASGKTKLIQHDHNSERFTFEIPRYIDGHDMMNCSTIEIHYTNISADRKGESSDIYLVDDVGLSSQADDIVIFSWLISGNATQYVGALNFTIKFTCLTGDNIDYRWCTAVYKSITIGETISNSEMIVAKYSDIIAAWKANGEFEGYSIFHLSNILSVSDDKRRCTCSFDETETYGREPKEGDLFIASDGNLYKIVEVSHANGDNNVTGEFVMVISTKIPDDPEPTPNAVVRRNYRGEVLVPTTPKSSNAAVSKQFVDTAVGGVDERVSLLEGSLLDYVEDSTAAYEKVTPHYAGRKAILDSAQGSVKATGKNLFNPANEGYPVNPDGSITISYDFGEENYFSQFGICIPLPGGTHYVNFDFHNFGDAYGTYLSNWYIEGDAGWHSSIEQANDTQFLVTCETDCVAYFTMELDGIGYCGADVYIMASKEPVPFEPYREAPTALTSVDVVSPNLLDYTELVSENIIDGGIRCTDYAVWLRYEYEDFLRLLGVSGGDTVTFSAKAKLYDLEGNFIKNITPYIHYEGPETSLYIDLDETGTTVVMPDYVESVFMQIDVPYDTGDYYLGDNGYVDITEIMAVKGTEKAPYIPFSNEPLSTVEIPSEVQTLAMQNMGCTIDFTNKQLKVGDESIDISDHLSDYAGYKFIDVMPSAILRFNNEMKADMQSTIVYTKLKGGN